MTTTFITSTLLISSPLRLGSLSRHTHRSTTVKRRRASTISTTCTSRAEVPSSKTSTTTSTPNDENPIIDGPFTGQFGEWYLRQDDVTDVMLYRSLLLISSLAILPCFILPQTSLHPRATLYEELTLLSAVSFGLSLKFIHIYARPLHTALKVMWSIGMVGCAVSCVLYQSVAVAAAVDHPAVLLTSGWILVALTGVFVKESVCFGRIHAGILALGIPILAGGHFLGVLGERGGQIEGISGAILALTYVWFAISKFGQDAKDDLGDLSVFEYLDKQQK